MTDAPSTPTKSSRMGAAIFIILGLCAFAVAGWQAWRTTSLLRNASHAVGVIAPDGHERNEVMTAEHPTVVFRTADGQEVRFMQNGMGSSRVGSSVPLIYLTHDPKGTAQAMGFWVLWSSTLLPLLMGVGLIGLPLLGAEIGVRGR